MLRYPGLAAIKNTMILTANKIPEKTFLRLILHVSVIIINIESGRNTEPKYEILLASNASSRDFEIASER